MGLQDRDYFWEDRKRREEQFKRDTYYRPREFRQKKGKTRSSDWKQEPLKYQWKTLAAFISGAIVSLLITMFALHINPRWISAPYYLVGRLVDFLGLK